MKQRSSRVEGEVTELLRLLRMAEAAGVRQVSFALDQTDGARRAAHGAHQGREHGGRSGPWSHGGARGVDPLLLLPPATTQGVVVEPFTGRNRGRERPPAADSEFTDEMTPACHRREGTDTRPASIQLAEEKIGKNWGCADVAAPPPGRKRVEVQKEEWGKKSMRTSKCCRRTCCRTRRGRPPSP